MSYERGMAAMRLEAPSEVPHTQYITHGAWLEHVRQKQGRPQADWPELLDFDFVWSVDIPPIPRGRWTDMGHAVFQADGSDYRRPVPSPWTDLEDIYRLDPLQEYGPVDLEEVTARYQAWWKEATAGRPPSRVPCLYPSAGKGMSGDACPSARTRKGMAPSMAPRADYVITGGTYNSVVSFAIAAFGWENLLLAAGTDEQRFGEVLDRWTDYLMTYVRAWAKTPLEVYHTHDDIVWTAGAVFRPQFYRRYVFPNLKRQWDCVKEAGKKVLFTSDGNYTEFLDDLAAAGADGFVFEPTTDLATVVRKFGRSHVIIGNADCRILTFGTPADVRREVARCLELGKNCPGYFFAVGNHIPPNVPIANAEACMEAYWNLRRR